MKVKSKYKKIFLVFMLLVVVCCALGTVQAAITTNSGGVDIEEGAGETFANTAGSVINYILTMGMSGVFATITRVIVLLTAVLFGALYAVFATATGTLSKFPMPDTIVFNRISIFDANFVNPSNGSIIKIFGSALGDLFASFQTIAITVFVIAAMIVGIQIALSTVASKKAQYKEAAIKWVTGLVLLISIKWIVAGIFYLNELLVAKLYLISRGTVVSIPVRWLGVIPVTGKFLDDLLLHFNVDVGTPFKGYMGILLSNMVNGIGGNIVASIVGFIILGQVLTIIGSYLKRVFMCVLLGVIAPLVVAVDAINTATGKNSNIFKNWLQNFTLTVFMQSIHALYMLVLFKMLNALYMSGFSHISHLLRGIITIVLTTGLIKLEKMIKSIFGIGDSFAGELKDGSKGIIKAMGAIKGITAGLSAVSDNSKKEKTASKNKQIYAAKLAELKAAGANTTVNNNTTNSIGPAANGGAAGAPNTNNGGTQTAGGNNLGSGTSTGTGTDSGTSTGKKSSGDDFLQDILKEGAQPRTREEKIKALEEAIAQEMANEKSAKLAKIFGTANLAAGAGISIGMGDEISEALFKGGYITQALDKAAETAGARLADKDRKSFAEQEAKDGKKYDYTSSEKIIREKTTMEKTVGNLQLYINPIAVEGEVRKQMKDVADVFTDQVKKKMKEIDKNIDNN